MGIQGLNMNYDGYLRVVLPLDTTSEYSDNL